MFARRCKPYLTLRPRLPMGPNGVRLHHFFIIDFSLKSRYNICYKLARMAKLADAQDLKSWEHLFVRVRFPLCA